MCDIQIKHNGKVVFDQAGRASWPMPQNVQAVIILVLFHFSKFAALLF